MGRKGLANVNKMLDGPAVFSVQGKHLSHLYVYFAPEICFWAMFSLH